MGREQNLGEPFTEDLVAYFRRPRLEKVGAMIQKLPLAAGLTARSRRLTSPRLRAYTPEHSLTFSCDFLGGFAVVLDVHFVPVTKAPGRLPENAGINAGGVIYVQ